MRGRQLADRLVALTVVAALSVATCQPTMPTPAPTATSSLLRTATPTESATRGPSTSPAPGPSAAPTVSGVVPVDVRLIGGPLNARMGPSGIWTGSEVIVWGGYHSSGSIARPVTAYPASGAAYTLYGDEWRRIADAPIPGRYRHIAGWTGREMIVWGGYTENRRQGTPPDGAAYNPTTDRWRRIAQAPLRWGQTRTSVMTDTEWVVAVTTKRDMVLAGYDPRADSWRLLPPVPVGPREDTRLVWASEALLFLDGDGMFRLADTGSWVRSNARAVGTQVVWTGSELISLDRYRPSALARYDPLADEWQDIEGPTVDAARLIWTGTHALLIADLDAPSYLYNPATEIWLELAWPERLHIRDHASVWADDQLVEWGGWSGGDGSQPTDAGWAVRPDVRHAELFDPSEP